MIRRIIAVMAVGSMGIAGMVFGEEGHQHGTSESTQRITGEVIDLACYLDHGAAGAGHLACASHCIRSGLPVGIKSGDTIYLAVGNEHKTANAALAPLAAQDVVVEGVVSERDGLKLIEITKVSTKS